MVEIAGLSEEEVVEVIEAGQMLAGMLQSDPAILTTIEEVLERHLREPITETTGSNLSYSLTQVIGAQASQFLSFYLMADEADPMIKGLREADGGADSAIAEAVPILQRLQALYGMPAAAASRWLRNDPGDFEEFNREVFFDAILDEWRVEIEISKVNGERLKFVGRPDSAVRLATYVLRTLNYVRDNDFTEEAINELLGETQQFVNKLGLTLTEAPPSPEASETPELVDLGASEAVPEPTA